jgi:hypothetical protein
VQIRILFPKLLVAYSSKSEAQNQAKLRTSPFIMPYFILSHMKKLLGCLLLAFLGACSPDKQNATTAWPTFGHDVSNNKFSALTNIDTSSPPLL